MLILLLVTASAKANIAVKSTRQRNSNNFDTDKIIELGNIIDSKSGRQNNQQTTVADLTGVAVQDIKIAELIYNGHRMS